MSVTATTQSTLLQQLYDELKKDELKTPSKNTDNVGNTSATSTTSNSSATDTTTTDDARNAFLLSLSPQAKDYLQSIGLLDNPATTTTDATASTNKGIIS